MDNNTLGGGYTISSPTIVSPFSGANFSFPSSGLAAGFHSFVSSLEVFLSFLSIFFMLAIIYIVIQRNVSLATAALHTKQLKKEKEKRGESLNVENTSSAEREPELSVDPTDPLVSEHIGFKQVREHLDSNNVSDWRFAIIEADNILFDILRRSGFPGETLGEMLSNANPASFHTLEYAWEAHKTRNIITHETKDFVLTKREAKRIINLYENVLREFKYL